MKKTIYQTQKNSGEKIPERVSEGVMQQTAKAYVKKLTDKFGPKGGFRCF